MKTKKKAEGANPLPYINSCVPRGTPPFTSAIPTIFCNMRLASCAAAQTQLMINHIFHVVLFIQVFCSFTQILQIFFY
jgi:hypothetical protein